jgi:hypothetical protein
VPAVRERARRWLAGAAADTLVADELGRRDELLPPNNARLLGELFYVTDLDAFDALAPRDVDLPGAIAALVERAGTAPDPFVAVQQLAKLQNWTGAVD